MSDPKDLSMGAIAPNITCPHCKESVTVPPVSAKDLPPEVRYQVISDWQAEVLLQWKREQARPRLPRMVDIVKAAFPIQQLPPGAPPCYDKEPEED